MPNQDGIVKVALYIRVSSEDQAENGDSIRDQKERCSKYINDHPHMILQEIYIDDGISGQKLNRDDFQRLLQDVKNNQINHIIFTKLDRWFRSLRHYLNTQAILEKHNVSWTAIDQPYFDTSTPYGRAFVAQSMTWAELEAQNGGQRVRDVFKTKIQHREVISGKIPRGYQIENKHLVLSNEAPAIRDSIAYFLKTQSMKQTITYMRDTYGIIMTMQTFRTCYLCNEKLTGRFRGVENYCPRIISDEMYQEIQNILSRNLNVRDNQSYPYIFSGLLVCDECGCKISGCQIRVSQKRSSGKVYRYKYPAYECKQYRACRNCINRGEIREVTIERYLLEHIGDQLDHYIAEYQSSGHKVIDNRSKKNKLRNKLERLKDLYVNELISMDEYKTDRTKLEWQLKELPDLEENKEDLLELKKLLNSNFETIYTNFSNEEKRVFWRSIIQEVRITKSVNRCREYKMIPL